MTSFIMRSAIDDTSANRRVCRPIVSLLTAATLLLLSLPALSSGKAVILNYHHVSLNESGPATVSVAQFRQHLDYIKRQGYHVISLTRLTDFLAGKRSIPKQSVCITFDDGYASYAEVAVPVLAEYKFPSTCFVIVADAGRKQASGRLPHMNWESMGRLKSSSLVSFGSHTYDTHALLPDSTTSNPRSTLAFPIKLKGRQETTKEYVARVLHDLKRARTEVKNQLTIETRMLAYPYGSVTDSLVKVAKSAGYLFCFTTDTGYVDASTDKWRIPRVNAGSSWVTTEYLASRVTSFLGK